MADRSTRLQSEVYEELTYIPQFFLLKIPKLSNKGWQTHTRIVRLDHNVIGYYRKASK